MKKKPILSSKGLRLGLLAIAVYSGCYVAARASKILVHRVTYSRYSVPNRDHLIGVGDFGSSAADSKAFRFAATSAEAVFYPVVRAEALVWRAIPRSYKYDYRVVTPRA
jgi:hypothetical protein